MQLLDETQVGNEIPVVRNNIEILFFNFILLHSLEVPFFMFFSFLNTLLVSSKSRLSPNWQISTEDVFGTHFSINSFKIPGFGLEKKACQTALFIHILFEYILDYGWLFHWPFYIWSQPNRRRSWCQQSFVPHCQNRSCLNRLAFYYLLFLLFV